MQVLSGLGRIFGGGGGVPIPGMNGIANGSGGIFGGGGQAASPWMKALGLGGLGMGMYNNFAQQSRYNQIYDQYNSLLRSMSDPAQMSARIAALQAPLSTALKQNVGNAVQGDMAARGLSQAPGLFASALAQGLAPYDIQNRQMAIQAAMAPTQLNPMYALATGKPQPTDMSGLMQGIYKMFNGGGSNGTTTSFDPSIFVPSGSSNGMPGLFGNLDMSSIIHGLGTGG